MLSARLTELLEYIRSKGICPMPGKWREFWDLLSGHEGENRSRNPGPPLVFGSWYSTGDPFKARLFQDQVEYAVSIGMLDLIDQWIRNLSDREWYPSDNLDEP